MSGFEIGLICVMVGVGIFLALRQWGGGKRRDKSLKDRVRDIEDRRVTSNGLKIWVEDGADITSVEIRAIEDGLTDCFTKAVKRGYHKPLRLSEYTIAILADSVRAPESGDWAYKVPTSSNYKGSEWDVNGSMYVAAEVIDIDRNIIALPAAQLPTIQDLATRRRAATYEAEHIIAYNCDYDLYLATQTHGQGKGHPIWE